MALTEAIFLDKDGTVLEDVPYNIDPAQMRFASGVGRGLRRLAQLGLPLIVVSNEPGVALGLFPEASLKTVNQQLADMFDTAGARLSAFYYCMHHPQGRVPELARTCQCRTPAAGLLRRAAAEHGINLKRSWFLGNTLDEIEAGRRAGCETILINNGHETQWLAGPLRVPHHVVDDFDQASRLIFESDALNAASFEPANDTSPASSPQRPRPYHCVSHLYATAPA